MKCGIYKISNDINNKVYIGQSIHCEQRWSSHKSNVCDPKKNKYPLYRDMKKYGIEHFFFEIIEECSKEDLNSREKFWIKYYNSFFDGYNLTQGGSTGTPTPQIDKNIIIQIIDDLENTNLNIKQIAEKNGVSRSTVGKINIGERWAYDREYPIRPLTSTCLPAPVVQIDIYSGDIINTFNSIEEAIRQLNKPVYSRAHITECCQRKRKTAFGFIWRYLSDIEDYIETHKRVYMFDKNMDEQLASFDTLKDAAQYMINSGLDKEEKKIIGNISRVCCADRGTAYGYSWRYR